MNANIIPQIKRNYTLHLLKKRVCQQLYTNILDVITKFNKFAIKITYKTNFCTHDKPKRTKDDPI